MKGAIKMQKSFIVLLVIGVIFLIIPFCFATYSLWRLLILCIGILLITLSMALLKRKNIFLIILTLVILLCLSYAVDTFIFYKFNHIPLFVYEIKSSDTFSTYNSFFYRIYNCNDELLLDYGYQKSYVCSDDALPTININDFLNDPQKSFAEYDNKFVKITGKISKLSGAEALFLSSYNTTENSLNGYVNFNTSYNVQVNVNESLSAYRIYDYITVIGRVSKLSEENSSYTINLTDTKLIPSDIYDSYSYEIVRSNNQDLISLVSEQNYYLYGISALNIKYANDAIYELSYLITDSRITLDDIIKDASATNLYDAESVLTAKAYELEKFNVLVCENDKKIIANKDLSLGIELCN